MCASNLLGGGMNLNLGISRRVVEDMNSPSYDSTVGLDLLLLVTNTVSRGIR